MTLGEKAAKADGHSSGFDYLRLCLALLILFFHSIAEQVPSSPVKQFMYFGHGMILRDVLVPMFFGVSGFLVAGSLDRTRAITTFLGLRALRIFPALWVDILVSALILGPLISALPMAQYFSSSELWRYFLNLVGEIHYTLPGVFKGNPNQFVNGQLWTVPWELAAYIAISVAAAAGLYAKRTQFLALVLVAQIGFPIFYYVASHAIGLGANDYHIVVFPCFLTGVLFHLYRDRIPFDRSIFLASVALIVVGGFVWHHALLLLVFPVLYVTVYLGLLNPRRLWFVNRRDYSYGTFLYHRAVQQTLWVLVPFAQTWYGNLALSLPVVLTAAFLSWHLIERRALQLKRPLMMRDAQLAIAAPMLAAPKAPPL